MALGEWLSGLGDRFMSNLNAAGPQGLASLGAAIASAPRNQWGTGVAQGLADFGGLARANKKKAALSEALKSATGGMSPEQQRLLSILEPEEALPLITSKVFGGGGKSWEAKDLDSDGRPDVQIDASTGKVEAYPLSYKDRAYNMLQEMGIAPVAPGVGVDARGNIVPTGGGQPAPQLRPTMAPEQAPPYQPAPMAEMEAPIPNNTEVVSAAPTGTPAPGPAPIVLSGDALARMKLPNAEPGKQWALDRQTLKPVQVSIPGVQREIPGEIAARLGLVKSFLSEADTTRQRIENGETSGVWNQGLLAANAGAPGEVWRKVSDGSDAMQRLLTGAGMPATEAANYAARFLPTIGDSKATQLSKFDQLAKNLKTVYETAARGRMSLEEIRSVLNLSNPSASGGGKTRIKFDASGNRVQ